MISATDCQDLSHWRWKLHNRDDCMTSGPCLFVTTLMITVDDNLYAVTTNRISHRYQWKDINNELQWHPSNPLTCGSPCRCRWGRSVQEIQSYPRTTLLPNHLDTPLNRSEDDLDVTRISHGNIHSKMHTLEHVGECKEGSIGSWPFM